MAYTKILFIRARLDDRVSYVTNEKKTALDGKIEYAVNGEKTEQRLYEAAVNCDSPETAYREMMATKKRWDKTGGVLGYHIIQSFAEGETTPDEAHEIGIELARRFFGDRFEAVIGTHLNTDNLHNHIVINSVSFKGGGKYQSTMVNLYRIREVSDTLCREHSLSVIQNSQGHGMNYAEYMAHKQGKRTWRDTIREDVDDAIACCRAPSQFIPTLRKLNYEVKENVKYIAVRPPKKERFVRLKSLGEQYEWRNIQRRIFEQKTIKVLPEPRRMTQTRSYRLKGSLPKKKLTGYRALYYHYLYKMGILPKNRASAKRVPFALREELYKLERINAETKLLCTHHIDTAEQLSAYQSSIEARMDTIAAGRKSLRNRARNCRDDTQAASFREQATELTGQLSILRREVKLCESIRARSEVIPQKLKQAKQEEQDYEKEMVKHEHQRGRGRSGR
ncbi:MAG: relaxase/mobilization nuclease domain-containing protein [Eubacteriales bacterium]|nr:relaxase/mobilization nuclease domain-containing protein [Eubacteriales bacterium]